MGDDQRLNRFGDILGDAVPQIRKEEVESLQGVVEEGIGRVGDFKWMAWHVEIASPAAAEIVETTSLSLNR